MKSHLETAVLNNMIWCEIVSKTHNIQSELKGHVWGLLSKAPPFYPDIITVSEYVTGKEVVDFAGERKVLSIKDSYANLDMEPFGFMKLFHAEWIYYPSVPVLKSFDTTWRVLSTEDELIKWTFFHGSETIITQDLLGRNDVKIFIHENQDSISGFIAALGAGAVGISNVFSNGYKDGELWADIVRAASSQYRNLPLVGYEQESETRLALSCGWRSLGSLCVWIKSD